VCVCGGGCGAVGMVGACLHDIIYHRCTYQKAITSIILVILELRSGCVGACVCVCSHDTIENIIIHTAHMKLEAINVSFDHVGALRVEVQVRMCMCLHDII